MKTFILTILILLTQSSGAQTDHQELQISKVAHKEGNCIEIPSSFSAKHMRLNLEKTNA